MLASTRKVEAASQQRPLQLHEQQLLQGFLRNRRPQRSSPRQRAVAAAAIRAATVAAPAAAATTENASAEGAETSTPGAAAEGQEEGASAEGPESSKTGAAAESEARCVVRTRQRSLADENDFLRSRLATLSGESAANRYEPRSEAAETLRMVGQLTAKMEQQRPLQLHEQQLL